MMLPVIMVTALVSCNHGKMKTVNSTVVLHVTNVEELNMLTKTAYKVRGYVVDGNDSLCVELKDTFESTPIKIGDSLTVNSELNVYNNGSSIIKWFNPVKL